MDLTTEIIERHIVPADARVDRLSEYARGVFESLPSRKSIVKAIKRDQMLVNEKLSTTGYWVQPGDEITVVANSSEKTVYDKELEVLFEDDYLAAILKPGDLPVSGNMLRTVANALQSNLKISSQRDRYSRPRPVHRLDRQTSGILVIVKTIKAASNLGAQFEDRTVKKTYRAIVHGETEDYFEIESKVDDRQAFTGFKKLRQVTSHKHGVLTELHCFPQTGRKNQIRVHLAGAGMPILGDQRFGGEKSGRGLLLFAESISFNHPETGERLHLDANPPKKFERFMRTQKKRPSQ
ncbi:RluA family pseudouridine synthase [Halocola ammonii]